MTADKTTTMHEYTKLMDFIRKHNLVLRVEEEFPGYWRAWVVNEYTRGVCVMDYQCRHYMHATGLSRHDVLTTLNNLA